VQGQKSSYQDGVFSMLEKVIELSNGDKILEYPNGDKIWCRNGIVHREGGPAKEFADGRREWYLHGMMHREDGPAYEGFHGTRMWYIRGKLHREDGPAQEWFDGTEDWYIGGVLHREDGAAHISPTGRIWWRHGFRHREGGAAVELCDGTRKWYIDGVLHREDGPAMILGSGEEFYYLEGFLFPSHFVMNPATILLSEIESLENLDMRSIAIVRYGWHRYLLAIGADLLDSRFNYVESTREALFSVGEFENRLLVTCPTGRVFGLGVPGSIMTCELAQRWLGNDESGEVNVIGRT
jgi:hypothetical protein